MLARLGFLFLLGLLLAGGNALAAIAVQYTYLDPYGTTKTATSTTPHINPNGTITFALAAGIDRKLEVAVISELGTTISTATSPVVSAEDRITVGASQYYGFFVDLQAPATDGNYTISARVLTYEGNQVYAEEYPVVIDRTPPSLIGGFGWDSWNPNYMYPMPPDTLVSYYGTYRHWVSDVVDATAGVDASSGRFQSLWLEGANAGSVAYEQPAVFDPATKRLSIPQGRNTSVRRSVYFPAETGRFLSRFVISDMAGNIASFELPIRWAGKCDAGDWDYIAVFDPDDTGNILPGSPFTGFVPYVPGMEVKTNPVKILLRIPRDRWHAYETYGVSVIHPAPNPGGYATVADFEDANYVYEVITTNYRTRNQTLRNENRMATRTIASCVEDQLRMPDLVLADTAPITPKFLKFEIELEKHGVTSTHIRNNRQDKIIGVTVTAEPRVYDQMFSAGRYIPGGSCVIPAGETTCRVVGANDVGDTASAMERIYQVVYVTSETGMRSNARGLLIEVDANVPKVNNAAIAHDGAYVDLEMSEYCTKCWSAFVGLKRAWLEADNGSSVTTIDAVSLETIDGNLDWTARVDLKDLTSGVYDLRFYARDKYGNVSSPFLIRAHAQDRIAPTVAVVTTSGDALGGSSIESVDVILVTVSDNLDPDPFVTSVRLTGGPLDDDVELGYHRDGDEYVLEYPVMLPSLEAGDYRLFVTAEDDFGNTHTESAVFEYSPVTFGMDQENGENIVIPIIDHPVRLSNGNWPLTSNEAIMIGAGGMPVIGVNNLIIGLSSDAQAPLNIGGLVIEPGGSATYTGYDFTANDGRIKLPMHFPYPSAVTEGVFGQIVVQIDRPNTPVFVERIVAWEPANSMDVERAQPSYARRVENVSLKIQVGGAGHCDNRLVAIVEGEVYRNLRDQDGVAICAVKWTGLPSGIEASASDHSVVTGRIESDLDAAVFRYQPGMLLKESGDFIFIPVGPEIDHQVSVIEPDVPAISVMVATKNAEQTSWLPAGKFPTAVGEFAAGNVIAQADFKGIAMTVVNIDTGEVMTDKSFSANYGRTPLETNIATVEGEAVFRVEARYIHYPEVVATADITFVALPKTPLIQIVRPQDPNNRSDTVLKGRFGISARDSFVFDPDAMGDWVIRIYRQQAGAGGTKTRQQIGQDVAMIDRDGDWSANLGRLDSGVYAILAVATYVGVSPTITGNVESKPTTIKVANGNQIVFSLTSRTHTGRPPITAVVKMRLEDSKRAGDVERIDWERSNNGMDFEPIVIADRYIRSFGYGERIATAGEYYYRATTTNRFSGATYTSDAIKIHIYDKPTFSLHGHNNTFIGHPVTWTAVADSPTRPALYKWSVRRGSYNDPDPLALDGENQTFEADVRGSWYITVHSRYADAPDVPGAWRKAAAMLKVSPPYMVRPRIVGPSYVETGQTYEYRVQTYPITRGDAPADIYVTGQWKLPNGETKISDTVSYTVQPGDTEIKYIAWVNGYRADTEVQSVIKLRHWEYEFPEFRLTRRLVREYDPVQYAYAINQTRTNTGGERPTLQWSFPIGPSVNVRSDVAAIVSASNVGEYPVSVRAYDTRGNEVILEDAFVVEEPPPLAASLRLVVGDNWSRIPVRVAARWYADGLLASERVRTIRMSLDGEPLQERLLNSYNIDVTAPGEHRVDMEMETTYGRTANASASVETIEGQLPTCEIVSYGNAKSYLRAQASCDIPMGRILSYHWWVTYDDTGETRDLGLRAAAISLSSRELARGIREIRLVAINDKGREAEPAIWYR